MNVRRFLAIAMLLTILATACYGGVAAPVASAPGASAAVSYPPALRPDQKVTISFTNYNLASAGIGKEATELLLREFAEKFPNITVEPRPAEATTLTAKVQAEVVAGNAPDLVQIIFSDLDFAVRDLRAKPLDGIVPPDEWKAYVGGEHPLHPRGLKLTELDGKVYGVPYVFSTPTLFYNADIFRQAGLDPDRPPRTWAEVKQYGLQIKAKTGFNGVTISCLGTFDWCYQALVLSNGGRVLSPDRTKLTFAEPAAVEAVTMWQDLVKAGVHASTALGASDAFGAGKVGMELQSSAVQARYLAGAAGKWELRAAPMPSFGEKVAGPTNSGSGLVILSEDPVKQRAAWELMRFLTSERGFTIIQSKIGYLTLRPSIVNDARYLKDWYAANPLARPNIEQLDRLEPWVAFPGANYQVMRDIMMKAVETVVLNGDDPRTTLQAAQERASALLPKR